MWPAGVAISPPMRDWIRPSATKATRPVPLDRRKKKTMTTHQENYEMAITALAEGFRAAIVKQADRSNV
jgi:hypothetical protein